MSNMDEVRMRQAADTADVWLRAVVKSVDDVMGDGYAKAHPDLVAAMLAASAKDFEATTLSASVDRLADALHSGLSSISLPG